MTVSSVDCIPGGGINMFPHASVAEAHPVFIFYFYFISFFLCVYFLLFVSGVFFFIHE